MDQTLQPRYLRVLSLLLTLFVFLAAMTFFRVREYTDKSLDLQVMIKLVAIAVTLTVPILAVVARRLSVTGRVHLVWLAFLASFVVSAAYAPNHAVSALDSLAFVGCFLFAIWLVQQFGETTVANLLVATVGFISLVSLIVYFVNPDLGRMHAWLGSEFGMNNRIKGIAGSPNGLGSMTSIALILTMLYYSRSDRPLRILMLCCAPFALICLVMSDNRTALAMLALAPVAMAARRGPRAYIITMIALAGVFALTVLITAPDLVLDSLSRTGESDEVTSGNGRSLIWSVVTELIRQKPIFGHGYASATFILPQDPRLFSVAAHTHNLYLEVLFSGGIMSFSLFLLALVVTAYYGIRNRAFEPLLILVFFLIRGLTEPAPFGSTPTFAGYAFFISLAFIAARTQTRIAIARGKLNWDANRMLDHCRSILARGAAG